MQTDTPVRDALRRIFASPTGQQIIAEERASREDRRRECQARLRAIRKEHERESRKLNDARQRAEQRVAEAREALQAAESELATAQGAAMGAGAAVERETSKLRRELDELADERITAYAADLADEWQRRRHDAVLAGNPAGREYLQALRVARAEALELAYTVPGDPYSSIAAITGRLQRLAHLAGTVHRVPRG